MGIAGIAPRDGKRVHLAPGPAIRAAQDDAAGRAEDAVAVGTGAEGEVVGTLELDEIRECIVAGVLADHGQGGDFD